MQVKFAIEPQLRRTEFIERALLFDAEIIKEIEPVQLSREARTLLADCNPDLPEVFKMLAPEVDMGADAEAARLWEIKINPNAYATAEIVELWAKEYSVARNDAQSVSANPLDA